MSTSINYKELFNVEILHDYYLQFNSEDDSWTFPHNYSILDDLDFIPTLECRKSLTDLHLIFKKNSKGFHILAQSIPSVITPGDSQTFININPDIKFQFFMVIKNPFFLNYSNLRLTGDDKYLYYFSNNLRPNGHPSGAFLSRPMLGYPSTISGETNYEVGDIVDNGSNLPNSTLFEAKINIATPGGALAAGDNRFIPIVHNTQYVTAQDRLNWQDTTYRYRQPNGNPGETFLFELINENGIAIPLGNVPNTDKKQGEFQATLDPTEDVQHVIDLSNFPLGRYTMSVTPSVSAASSKSFFLLNPMLQPKVFGIMEFYASPASADFQFVRHQNSGLNIESVIERKSYKLRFKNRTTIWKYFGRNKEELTFEENPPGTVVRSFRPRIGLTKQYGQEKFNANTVYELNIPIDSQDLDFVPDAQITRIYPQRDTGNPLLIDAIYSEIYLNQ